MVIRCANKERLPGIVSEVGGPQKGHFCCPTYFLTGKCLKRSARKFLFDVCALVRTATA